jgi:hypothetical protein
VIVVAPFQCIITTPTLPEQNENCLFHDMRQVLSATSSHRPNVALNLQGNTIIFDSFSSPTDIEQLNTIVNNVSKVNDPSRQFDAKFAVNIDGKVGAILHADSVTDYMVVDKQSKQVIIAPNKHPTRDTVAAELAEAAANICARFVAAAPESDQDFSQETVPSTPSPEPNPKRQHEQLQHDPNKIARTSPQNQYNMPSATSIVIPSTFRMAPPLPILTAMPMTVDQSPGRFVIEEPKFTRPGNDNSKHTQANTRHFINTMRFAGLRPLFCPADVYRERKKRAEQTFLSTTTPPIFAVNANFPSTVNNSDEIILLSGNTTSMMSNPSTEILRCVVPVQNILKSTPATPRCSTDELEAINTLVGMKV